MAIAENTHWYQRDGKPCYQITGKNGNVRPATLRDARVMGLLPGVTSIIGVAAKPALTNWLIDQALLAALTLPRGEGESLDGFMARAKQDAKDQSQKAAERGTAIHADIERGFSGQGSSEAYRAVCEALCPLAPDANWIAEDSFGSPLGYGGKVDLYCRSGIVVDFKTKELKPDDRAERLVYDEHGMQLSAYAEGLEMPNARRISVFICRNNPSNVLVHEWDKESHAKHWSMFRSLLDYWQASKGYTP